MKGFISARPGARYKRRCFPIVRTLAVVGLATLVTAANASAAMIQPNSYNMRNGQKGAFDYSDQTYNGSGNTAINLDFLSGGLGDLSDGVIPETSWSETAAPFVGWVTVDPTIRFNFESVVRFNRIDFYFDDTEGTGGVSAPARILLSDGNQEVAVDVVDNPERGRLLVSLGDLELQGNFVDAQIIRAPGDWVMLSEVQFDGELAAVPEPVATGGTLLATFGVSLLLTGRRRK